jgi:hypothetical protein
MSDRPGLKEYAEFFIGALSAGVVSLHEVAVWADSIIEKAEKPPIEIIEVTLACNRNAGDAMSCLRAVKGDLRPDAPINLMAACLLRKLQKDEIEHGKAIRVLYETSWLGTDSELQGEIAEFEDCWCLAEKGIYGNIEDLKQELEIFLEKRRDYIAHLPIS